MEKIQDVKLKVAIGFGVVVALLRRLTLATIRKS